MAKIDLFASDIIRKLYGFVGTALDSLPDHLRGCEITAENYQEICDELEQVIRQRLRDWVRKAELVPSGEVDTLTDQFLTNCIRGSDHVSNELGWRRQEIYFLEHLVAEIREKFSSEESDAA